MNKFNDWLAIKITQAASSMYMAYLLVCVSFWGLYGLDWTNHQQVTNWVSQNFFQLILPIVILVGAKRIDETNDKDRVLIYEKTHQELLEIKQLLTSTHPMISEDGRLIHSRCCK